MRLELDLTYLSLLADSLFSVLFKVSDALLEGVDELVLLVNTLHFVTGVSRLSNNGSEQTRKCIKTERKVSLVKRENTGDITCPMALRIILLYAR